MNFTKRREANKFSKSTIIVLTKWIFFGKLQQERILSWLQWTAYYWQIANITEVEPLSPLNVTCDQNKHFACNKANKLLGAVNQDLNGSLY